MLNKIGNYLGKNVYYKHFATIDKYKTLALSDSVLLIFFCSDRKITESQLNEFFQKIVSNHPLSIVISGDYFGDYFDVLLRFLSECHQHDHIMTYAAEPKESLDMFFDAAWPVEERHDDWSNYKIIEIGDAKIEKNILKKISSINSNFLEK